MNREEAAALMRYAAENPKLVKTAHHERFPLVKLSYTHKCAHDRVWNEHTIASRGIIIETGSFEVIARPFDKFFNLGEMLQPDELPSEDYTVVEKMDGVLVIPYLYEGNVFFSTRGSFDNQFIDAAYGVSLSQKLRISELSLEKWTYMFELIHPTAHILTDYGDRQSLVLLGRRHTERGTMGSPVKLNEISKEYGLEVVETWDVKLDQMAEWREIKSERLDEGLVIQFEGGLLIKVKRADYVRITAAIRNVNAKTVIDLVSRAEFEVWRDELPEEIQAMADELARNVQLALSELRIRIDSAWDDLRDIPGRKDLALTIYADPDLKDLAGFLFALRDGKDPSSMIWQHLRRNHRDLEGGSS